MKRSRTSDWFPKQKLGDLPADASRRWPHRQAFSFEGRTWTYAEFAADVDRAAVALVEQGVQPGDKVALWITNRPEFLFLLFGALRAGAVAVPLNTRWRTRDLLAALRHCQASTLVSETVCGPVDFESMVREVLHEHTKAEDGTLSSTACPDLRRVLFLGAHSTDGALQWSDALRGGAATPARTLSERSGGIDPDAMALIMYTSGTTGTPKGVMLSHIGIRLSVERALAVAVTQNDVQLNYLPMFHVYSLSFVTLLCLLTGAKQVIMNRFDAAEVLRVIEQERVTMLHGFDTHYRELLSAVEAGPGRDLRSLRLGTFSAGMDTARALVVAVQHKLCKTVSTYGQSESWGAVATGAPDCSPEQSSAASGYPLPGVELRIVHPETGIEVATGEPGEILVRNYAGMLGYYDAEEETRAAIDADGWFHTDDTGCMRADGHLRFMGRYKDMLKVGGENVDPAEVETLLLESPLVQKVAVVGCPDARLSEVAAAFVVPAEGARAEDVFRHIDELCRGRIASFKAPKRIEIVRELPVNAAGKVDRKALRALLGPTDQRE